MSLTMTHKMLRCIALVVLALALLTADSHSNAQGDPTRPQIRFEPYAGNPVLTRSAVENWGGDCGSMFAPKVIQHGGRYYMFYTGSCNRQAHPAAIGLATSEDGATWTKHEQNPILKPDGEGFDAMCVSVGVPMVDGDTWVLYFASNAQPCAGTGRSIGRATASSPEGVWQRDASPVLTAGQSGDWDAGYIMPQAVLRTEDGYVMYYAGGTEYLIPLPRLIGIATSPDGIHWTKYDDPTTTQAPFQHSDPLLEVNADGTTSPLGAWAVDILKTESGWEMFYSGTCPEEVKQGCPGFIAYATSTDGVRWTTYLGPERVVLTPNRPDQPWASHCVCYPSVLKNDTEYRLYYSGCTDETNDCQIGLATGTIQQQ